MSKEVFYLLNPWWENRDFDIGLARPEYLTKLAVLNARAQIEVLVGSRRVGKTTLLKQLINEVLEAGVDAQAILYLALDHPRLIEKPISEHLALFRQIFNHPRGRRLWLFLDEIQESPNWQLELKGLYDTENLKIVCTGSTASLLQSAGGKLTGRQIVTRIYPLDFPEFLTFKGGRPSAAEEYRMTSLTEEYLQVGGYPENVLHPSQEYLANLLEDILARDIAHLHDIRRADVLKDLFRLTAASVGSRVSYNKLSKVLGTALETVREYIGYFETAFLLKGLTKWTTSHSEKVYAGKKLYVLDNGLKSLVSGEGDLGAKAETAVFLRLIKSAAVIGYFAHSEKEVDFVVGERPGLPIEVKYDYALEVMDRRLAGLRLFLRRNPDCDRALVVTKDYRHSAEYMSATITFLPLWEFLLAEGPNFP